MTGSLTERSKGWQEEKKEEGKNGWRSDGKKDRMTGEKTKRREG
jgi:hypothetical protein